MSNVLTCKDCPYSWIDGFWSYENDSENPEFIETEKYPSCHYAWDDGYAPCEV